MPNLKKGVMGAAGAGGNPDDGVWVWGMNNFGQLANGNTSIQSSPVQILNEIPTYINMGERHIAIIKQDGTLHMAGRNDDGQLGLGDTTDRSSLTQVGSDTDWDQVACGFQHCIARKTNGTIFTWGDNANGELGLGDTTDRSSPVQVGSLTSWTRVSATHQLCLGWKGTTLEGWGDANSTGLGTDTGQKSSPVQIGTGFTNTRHSSQGANGHMLSLHKTNNTVVVSGYGYRGGLDLNVSDKPSTTTLTQIGSAEWSWIALGHFDCIGRKTNGQLFGWGSNFLGAAGTGNTGGTDSTSGFVAVSSPVQIGTSITWRADNQSWGAGNMCFAAIDEDNQLYTWGSGYVNGNDSTSGNNVPTKVGAHSDYSMVGIGYRSVWAIRDSSLA